MIDFFLIRVALRGGDNRAIYAHTAGKSPPKVIQLVESITMWGRQS